MWPVVRAASEGGGEERRGEGAGFVEVGLLDHLLADELEEVGLAAGGLEDLLDDAGGVTEVERGVWIFEQLAGLRRLEVEYLDGAGGDGVAAPAGAGIGEGLDAAEEEGELGAVLDEVANLVEEGLGELALLEGVAELFDSSRQRRMRQSPRIGRVWSSQSSRTV